MTPLVVALLFAQAAAERFEQQMEQAEHARAAGQIDSAISGFEKAVVMRPDSKEGWWALGGLYYQKDRYSNCRSAFSKLIALDANAGPAWVMRGLCAYGAKDGAAALSDLEQGRQLGCAIVPLRQTGAMTLAQIYILAEEFEKAMGVLAAEVQVGDTDPRLGTLAGLAALRRPARASEVPAPDRELVYLSGSAFQSAARRHVAEAETQFQDLVKRYPQASGVHFFYGSFLLQSEPDKAIAEFEKELAIHPDHVPALAALAYEYLRREDTEKGLPYAREAAQLKPGFAGTHAILGRLLVQSGDLEGGLKELETAKRLAPDDPQPRIALASLYAKLGRKEEAARERNEFKRLSELKKSAVGQ